MSSPALVLGRQFAAALDAEDYTTLSQLLESTCEYVTPNGAIFGIEPIVKSYRDASNWVKSNIQCVNYESAVRIIPDGRVVVTFIDHLKHADVSHTYACEQEIDVDAGGKIRKIINRELPGHREAVENFLQRIGASRHAPATTRTDG